MRLITLFTTTILAAAPAFADTAADRRGDTPFNDPSIKHAPKDGVVKLYGAGGPHTAFRKVAAVFEKDTGVKVEIIAGPESKWSRQAMISSLSCMTLFRGKS